MFSAFLLSGKCLLFVGVSGERLEIYGALRKAVHASAQCRYLVKYPCNILHAFHNSAIFLQEPRKRKTWPELYGKKGHRRNCLAEVWIRCFPLENCFKFTTALRVQLTSSLLFLIYTRFLLESFHLKRSRSRAGTVSNLIFD